MSPPSEQSKFPLFAAAILYGIVVSAAVWRHEPWADEAQAWLLARDCGFIELWTHRLGYEGTPGLWHSMLYILTRVDAPYRALNILSAVLGAVAAWLVIFRSPFPLWVRLSLPFTFFLCYQYAVIARSYSLLPPLLFSCAVLWKRAERHWTLFIAVLSLIAAVSAHGFVLSAAIWFTFSFSIVRRWRELSHVERRRFFIAASIYLTVLILLAWSAWPAKDVAFPFHLTLSFKQLGAVSLALIEEAFLGEPLLSFVVIALSVPFLHRGNGLSIFILSSVLLCAVAGIIHTQLWHAGPIFLAWLFGLWISWGEIKPGRMLMTALAAVILMQCYWSARSLFYDWRHAYSGSLEAARYLQREGLTQFRIYGAGYPSTALQPYFPRSIFANFNDGQTRAYWDWSKANHGNDASLFFSNPLPDYIVAGYKTNEEKRRWGNLLSFGGYSLVRNFSGYLYWHNRTLEPEAYDIYRRGSDNGIKAASVIRMGDERTANQLLDGFYSVESGSWRWVAQQFTVALGAPTSSRDSGAKLELQFFLPEDHLQKLGTVTLRAEVDGMTLAPQTFSTVGNQVYSADLPPATFRSSVIAVSFAFDKALPPTATDARELAAIVSGIALVPK